MHKDVPVETDELEDELELHDEELRKQIAEGYEAYLREETEDIEKLVARLRNELTPHTTRG